MIFSNDLFKNYGIILTGHSLGAGTSQVLAFLFNIFKPRFLNEEKFKIFGFGSPQVFSEEFENYYGRFSFQIINQYDLIPRISFGSIKDLIKVIENFNDVEVSFYELLCFFKKFF